MDKIQTFFLLAMNVDITTIFSANYDEQDQLVDENGNNLEYWLINDLICQGFCMPGSIYSKGPYSEEFSEWFIGYKHRHTPIDRSCFQHSLDYLAKKQQELLKREHAYQLSLKNESNDDSSSDVEVVDVVTPQDKENIARAAAIEID